MSCASVFNRNYILDIAGDFFSIRFKEQRPILFTVTERNGSLVPSFQVHECDDKKFILTAPSGAIVILKTVYYGIFSKLLRQTFDSIRIVRGTPTIPEVEEADSVSNLCLFLVFKPSLLQIFVSFSLFRSCFFTDIC